MTMTERVSWLDVDTRASKRHADMTPHEQAEVEMGMWLPVMVPTCVGFREETDLTNPQLVEQMRRNRLMFWVETRSGINPTFIFQGDPIVEDRLRWVRR